MIVKESEAVEKFCPMGIANAEQIVRCCGEDCMAWREVEPGKGYCGICGSPFPPLVGVDRAATGLSMLFGRGGE
jgi:hypothetical protein